MGFLSRLGPRTKFKRRKKKKFKKHKNLKSLRVDLPISRAEKLQLMSKQLQDNPPKSERWFLNLFRNHWLETDLFNTVSGPYIPDFINHTFKYVIEIDGTVHLTAEQQKKDLRKNIYFRDLGYTIIRIVAHDIGSYEKGLKQILRIREVNNNL
jgi:very-short-patch-repair endonuclease